MQAIILAAGMGKRLKELTRDNTKCMVQVNGVTLIERLLRQLEPYRLTRIVLVVGYEGKKLVDYVASLGVSTPLEFVENPIYDQTNNIYSLFLAKEYLLKEDTLLFESDLIFEDSVIEAIVNDPRPTLALVDKYESWMDGTVVRLSAEDDILEFIPGKKINFADRVEYYKTVNVYKFSKHFSKTHYVPFLKAYCAALGRNEYYEQVLKVIAMLDDPEIKAKRLTGQLWYEIDDLQDLDIATSIFSPNADDKIKLMQGRYGGYWRYPKLVDFCYLVNPYFPPARLLEEIKANFAALTQQYPSGMRVNSLLAAKNFGVRQEFIVVGNGASELIKSLCGKMRGRVGVVRPTFEEYAHRFPEGAEEVTFRPENEDFSYTAADLMAYFEGKDLSWLILINPDNPSGNYLRKAETLDLIRWAKERGIRIVVDESFVDFSDEADSSLIENAVLRENPHLSVVKSISKCYGVPGFRLGILCSGDEELIAFIKKDVGIWNINSFGEFYMQIAEKYQKDYAAALDLFRKERERFYRRLSGIAGLHVTKSQANYFLLRLTNGASAKDLVENLLVRDNLFLKDLSEKAGGPYLRVAVRGPQDNDRLIDALSAYLHSD